MVAQTVEDPKHGSKLDRFRNIAFNMFNNLDKYMKVSMDSSRIKALCTWGKFYNNR